MYKCQCESTTNFCVKLWKIPIETDKQAVFLGNERRNYSVVYVSSMYIGYLHLPWVNSDIQAHIMCFMKLSATKFWHCPEAHFVDHVF